MANARWVAITVVILAGSTVPRSGLAQPGTPAEAPPTEAPPEAPPTEAPPEAPPTEAPPEAPPAEAPPPEAPPPEAPPPEAPPTEAPPTEAPPTEAPPTETPARTSGAGEAGSEQAPGATRAGPRATEEPTPKPTTAEQAAPAQPAAPTTPPGTAPAPTDTPAPPPSKAPGDASATPAHPHRFLEARPPVLDWQRERPVAQDQRGYRGGALRFSAGMGLASARRDGDPSRVKVSGYHGLLAVDVGGAIRDNLIGFGRLGAFAVNHANQSDSRNAGTAYFALLGAGARYHFMPHDLYASGTLSLALMSVTSDLGDVENANPGVGFEVEAGKNFSVGDALDARSVGLGLRFGIVHCAALGGGGPWLGSALSLVFSTMVH